MNRDESGEHRHHLLKCVPGVGCNTRKKKILHEKTRTTYTSMVWVHHRPLPSVKIPLRSGKNIEIVRVQRYYRYYKIFLIVQINLTAKIRIFITKKLDR